MLLLGRVGQLARFGRFVSQTQPGLPVRPNAVEDFQVARDHQAEADGYDDGDVGDLDTEPVEVLGADAGHDSADTHL